MTRQPHLPPALVRVLWVLASTQVLVAILLVIVAVIELEG